MEYLIRDDVLKAIADEVRRLTGTEETMTLGEMKEALAGVEPGGGSSDLVAAIADGSITELTAEDFGEPSKIRDYFLYGCTRLSRLELPDTLTSVSDYAFYGCSGLSYIKTPYNVYFEYDAFTQHTNVDTVVITNGGKRSGGLYFETPTNCPWYYARHVVIESGVNKIKDFMFNGCTKLTSITLPDSITDIGTTSFGNCKALTDVYYEGTEEEWTAINLNTNNDYLLNATIHYNTPM